MTIESLLFDEPHARPQALNATAKRSAVFGIKAVWSFLVLARRRARTRKQLAKLSPELLRDIGVSRYEAVEELRKPFWR